jgi:hypothetical protein
MLPMNLFSSDGSGLIEGGGVVDDLGVESSGGPCGGGADEGSLAGTCAVTAPAVTIAIIKTILI